MQDLHSNYMLIKENESYSWHSVSVYSFNREQKFHKYVHFKDANDLALL